MMNSLTAFYAHLLDASGADATPASVSEPSAASLTPRAWTERHLQCIWADDALRPRTLCDALTGELIEVVDPGTWNLEAGPDFLNAVLRTGERILSGDIEIHVRPAGWNAHGHAANPLYRNVVAHVTWFPGPRPATLPPAAQSIVLAPLLVNAPGFTFDAIDPAAYPHAALPGSPRPCEALLARLPPAYAGHLLDAAGAYRIAAKAAHFRERLRHTTPLRLFHEELFAALGYKNNDAPFRLLAQLYPPDTWGDGPRELHFARLLGIAGLLPSPTPAMDPDGRAFLRRLWDYWWVNQGRGFPRFTWNHPGRPQNAPYRRLAAAVAMLTAVPPVYDQLAAIDPAAFQSARWHRAAAKILSEAARWPEVETRATPAAPPGPPVALLGAGRIAAILTNLWIPLRLSELPFAGLPPPRLPRETLSAPMRETAVRLFGAGHDPALYASSGLRQQGLLQLRLNFCMTTRTGCAHCGLLGHLRDALPRQDGA